MNRTTQGRIFIIEQDPTVADFISRQILQAAGYSCQIFSDAAEALKASDQVNPDLILIDLNISGLGAKDFIVAVHSQREVKIPVIVVGQTNSPNDVIQSFRIGAADYLTHPLREAEILAAVDRVFEQIRSMREKEQLSQQLQIVNIELQKRVEEFSTISTIGKAVLSITDQSLLFDKILQESIRLTRADMGWFMLRTEEGNAYILAAQKKLPAVLAAKVNQTWDDGLTSFVSKSGESLSIHGDALNRFTITQLGKSALIIPVKVKQYVIGTLVVMRKANQSFSPSEQKILEAIVDYVSVSIINARLFRAVKSSTDAATKMIEQNRITTASLIKQELFNPLTACRNSVDALKKHERQIPPSLRKLVNQIEADLDEFEKIIGQIERISPDQTSGRNNE